jgi:ABC-2 type transport system ATP-binding protein
MTTDTAISTAGLTKHYPGVRALNNLSLEVPAGSIFGFLGPNGAGKSTAIKLLAGLTRPTKGSATVAGVPIDQGAAFRQRVGYLGQEPRFYDWMTGRETLRFVASLYPAEAHVDDARIDQVLTRVGVADAADRRTGTYSGGMRQRLGIGQAIVARPDVLLLDEPVSALDPIGRREVLELMQDLKGEATVFYSTHILDDVQRVSDDVAILDRGHLVAQAPTSELLASFTKDRLRVVLGGADDSTSVALTGVPGVVSVEPSEREDALRTYVVRIQPDSTPSVQAGITRFAAANHLFVVENRPDKLGLEDVFLRLVNTQERAA